MKEVKQNLFWAVGYNTIAFPIAAGVFYPSIGLLLRPEIAALSMAGSSLLAALNALLLKRAKLPGVRSTGSGTGPGETGEGPRPAPAASPEGETT